MIEEIENSQSIYFEIIKNNALKYLLFRKT